MKTMNSIVEETIEMEDIVSVCFGNPRGDELPQVAGIEDILIDVFSDMGNVPREIAAGMFHHQYMNDLDGEYKEVIH